VKQAIRDLHKKPLILAEFKMTTSILNLTLTVALTVLLTSSTAFADFPFNGNKHISINGSHVSIHSPGKHIEMSPGNGSIHGSGKHVVLGNGHVSIHGSGKHIEINNGSYNSRCYSNVVYTAPPVVNCTPSCEHEVVCTPPVTTVNYQPVVCEPQGPSYEEPQYVNSGLEPVNSTYVIEPGDTFYEVSLKMYSTSDAAQAIAMFNRIPLEVKLQPGTVVYLPSISADGMMTPSQAPPAGVQ